MGAFDDVDLSAFTDRYRHRREDDQTCAPPQYVEPEVGGVYRMEYGFVKRGNVTVLGVFEELVVVRHEHAKIDWGGYTSYEQAVVRQNAGFLLVDAEVASTT